MIGPICGFVAALFTSTSTAPKRSMVSSTHAAACLGVARVGGDPEDGGARDGALDHERSLVQRLLLPGGDHDGGAGAGEGRRDRPPDPP